MSNFAGRRIWCTSEIQGFHIDVHQPRRRLPWVRLMSVTVSGSRKMGYTQKTNPVIAIKGGELTSEEIIAGNRTPWSCSFFESGDLG